METCVTRCMYRDKAKAGVRRRCGHLPIDFGHLFILLHRVVHSKFPGFLGDLPSWSLVSGSVNNVLLDIVTRCFRTFLRTVLIQVHVQS